jgi:hypothetical protein
MRLVFLTTLTVGCLAEVDVNVDPDGDGLSDAEEAELGTDRVIADSDGDGFDDGAELIGKTDPLDEWSKPYDQCRDSIVGTGNAVGEISFDWELPNQWETTTRLYNYCDRVALLIFAGIW